ncbi:uncharacterized protein [Mytilus edulis]|uniref:uncharacterized protein n=1 Tax=Mytilus edulis TaxID=6550 RepID=UPI0039F0E62F
MGRAGKGRGSYQRDFQSSKDHRLKRFRTYSSDIENDDLEVLLDAFVGIINDQKIADKYVASLCDIPHFKTKFIEHLLPSLDPQVSDILTTLRKNVEIMSEKLSKSSLLAKGWGHNIDPKSSETTVGDDIERIRRCRNVIAHPRQGNLKLTDTQLTQWFSTLKDVAKRMEKYLDKRDGDFTNKFVSLDRDELNDINDSMLVQIEEWKKLNEKFVSTDLCKKLLHTILTQKKKVTTVYGISGIGKSATVHHVALLLREKHQYEVLPCHSPEDIINKFREKTKQAFVFDDVCGRYSAMQNEINSWIKNEPALKRITREEEVRVITSCRLQVFKEEQFQRIGFLKECSIEFTGNLITHVQKQSICEKYLDSHLIPAIENVINKYDFFPLMCSLYNNHREKDVVEFFENPLDIYMSEFDNIKQEPQKVKYFTILLIVLCNGEVCFPVKEDSDTDLVQNNINLENLLNEYGILSGTPKSDIKKQMELFEGTFFKIEHYSNKVGKEIVIYRSIHAKLFDYMCHHCGLKQNFQNVIIKYARSSLLSQRTRLESLTRSEEAPIVISTENEEKFFGRMIDDILDVNSENVLRSPQMKLPEFRQKLIRFISGKAHLMQKAFEDKHIRKKLLNRIFASNYSDLFASILYTMMDIENYLIDILDLAYSTDKQLISRPAETVCLVNTAFISVHEQCYTPLVCACFNGHAEIVKLLIYSGARVNCNASHKKCSPLIAAVMGNFFYIVDIILKNRDVDVNIADNKKVTPLMVACNIGNYEVVYSLVMKGAKLDVIDKCGQTALMFASRHGYSDIVEFLCEQNANIYLKSRKKRTALMFACKGGHKNIVGTLINKGSGVRMGKQITSSLHIADNEKFYDLSKFLIEKGARVDNKDNFKVIAIKSIDTEDKILVNSCMLSEENSLNNTDDIAKSENDDFRREEEIEPNDLVTTL